MFKHTLKPFVSIRSDEFDPIEFQTMLVRASRILKTTLQYRDKLITLNILRRGPYLTMLSFTDLSTDEEYAFIPSPLRMHPIKIHEQIMKTLVRGRGDHVPFTREQLMPEFYEFINDYFNLEN